MTRESCIKTMAAWIPYDDRGDCKGKLPEEIAEILFEIVEKHLKEKQNDKCNTDHTADELRSATEATEAEEVRGMRGGSEALPERHLPNLFADAIKGCGQFY